LLLLLLSGTRLTGAIDRPPGKTVPPPPDPSEGREVKRLEGQKV
jgi:hypothetical protein